MERVQRLDGSGPSPLSLLGVWGGLERKSDHQGNLVGEWRSLWVMPERRALSGEASSFPFGKGGAVLEPSAN